MSLAAHTGKKRSAPCERCGGVVLQEEIAVASGPGRGVRFWSHEPHDAPCGLPCAQGGLYGGSEALKRREFHGSERFPCPRCGPKSEE